LTPPATDVPACVLLVTGRAECRARFEQGAFQLVLCRDGEEERVDLGFSGSRVLERLLSSPGQVVSRDELLQYAWQDRVVSQGSLNQQIYTLRQLLSDSASQIIQTLPRRGYLFNPNHLLEASETAPVQPSAAAAQPATIIEPHVPAAAAIPRPSPWLAPTVLGTAVALLLAVVALGYRFMHTPKGSLTHSHSIGQLEVLYVEKSQQMLERMMQETRLLVSSIAGLNTHPSRLIVNMSPGFYELRCLRRDGQVNWLKIHRSQVNSISNETLQGCLR